MSTKGKAPHAIEAQNCYEKALTLNYSYLSLLKKEYVNIKLQESILLQEKFLP